MKSSRGRGKQMMGVALASAGLMNWVMLVVCSVPAGGLSRMPAESAGFAQTGSSIAASRLVMADSSIQSRVSGAYGKLPLSFEPNLGQDPDAAVRFISHSANYAVALTPAEAVFTIRNSRADARDENSSASSIATQRSAVLRMKLRGATRTPLVEDSGELPGKVNYFLGSDPTGWRANVPAYSRVTQKGVYPGVDLVYYGNQQELEYDFIVSPGADPRVISLEFEGAQSIRLDGNGDLVLTTARGDIRQHKPRAYQIVGGKHKEISARTVIKGKRRVSFKLSSYDRTRPLVIDPVLSYSTYIAIGDAVIYDIAVDALGNAYVIGNALTSAFRSAAGSLDLAQGNYAVFVTKLNPAGTTVVYSSIIGGKNGNSIAGGIAIDGEGNAYISGITNSSGFPTTSGAFQPAGHGLGNDEGFVAKLNAAGSALVYSTYLGGRGGESAHRIAVDAAGSAYITGATGSDDFPVTPSAFQTHKSGSSNTDSYVAKLNAAGSGLVYSTYLGGAGIDVANCIAVDQSGNAYVTGRTSSADFPTTPGALQPAISVRAGTLDYAAFVTKVNSDGSQLVYSTFLGDSSIGNGIAVDASGNAYVTGEADSDTFPIVNALQSKLRGGILIKSSDGAGSWSLAAGGLPKSGTIATNPAIDPQVPSRIYAAVFPGGLFRSTDSGDSWAAIGKGLPSIYFVASIVIDPVAHATVYLGLASSPGGSLYKSTDGGDTWNFVSSEVSGFHLRIDPKAPSTLYASNNDLAFTKSSDRGNRWSIANQHMPAGAKITDIAVDPQTPSTLYVTTLEDVLKSTDRGDTWAQVADVKGANPRIAIDPKTPSTVYFVSDRSDFDVASVKGRGNPRKRAAQRLALEGLCKSTDSGDTWETLNTGLESLFIPYALVIDPLDTSTIYVGAANGLYKSTDGASTWKRADFFMSPTALAISPAADRSLYAANRAGGAATDAFVSKLNPQGTALVYSTLMGGLALDVGQSIALDAAGGAYVSGYTASRDFPVTAEALQRTHGGGTPLDAFVAKLSASGATLDYSSYLGGSSEDSAAGIALDAAGNVFVAGYTISKNFPTVNPIQNGITGAARGSFITKMNLSVKGKGGPTVTSVLVKGKKLIVNGEGFSADSRILIDGVEQETSSDDQNSGTLISKAGKKVNPGRTVMIQVRNSDGAMSNEYSFARAVE